MPCNLFAQASTFACASFTNCLSCVRVCEQYHDEMNRQKIKNNLFMCTAYYIFAIVSWNFSNYSQIILKHWKGKWLQMYQLCSSIPHFRLLNYGLSGFLHFNHSRFSSLKNGISEVFFAHYIQIMLIWRKKNLQILQMFGRRKYFHSIRSKKIGKDL